MVTIVGRVIRAARRKAGLTQDALAAAIGCSKAQLSLMESGDRTVSPSRARAIEHALGIGDGRIAAAAEWAATPRGVRRRLQRSAALQEDLRLALRSPDAPATLRALLDGAGANLDESLPLVRRIPLINDIAAGLPAEFTDLDHPVSFADDYIACPDVTDPGAFAARVVGDSMAPEYREGEIVVFSPALPVDDGTDCFVRLARDGETTFKRVFTEAGDDRVRLQPLNPAYPPRIVGRDEVSAMFAAAYVMRRVERPPPVPRRGGREAGERTEGG
jgi:phage repressor protein C with HTH and peptisase S24 domain/DNA-binding XRE family transcriptional regulator